MSFRRFSAFALCALLAAAPVARAQSTAINGTIEGVVADSTGAVLPGVTLTLTNTETGSQRSLTTGTDGGYRAPLLSLGTYNAGKGTSVVKRGVMPPGKLADAVLTAVMRLETSTITNAPIGTSLLYVGQAG